MDACDLVLALARATCRLPRLVSRGLALALGGGAARLWRGERRRLLDTLDRVYHRAGRPPPRPLPEIVDHLFVHFALVCEEVLRLPQVTAAELAARFHFTGVEHFEAALARGRGVILVVPHLGNWELLGAAIAHHGWPLHSFYLAQKERDIGAALDLLRRHSRIVLHDRDRGAREALRALKQGEVLGMIADQDGGNQAVYTEFCGHFVSVPAGPANWSLRTGAAVMPLFALRRGCSPHYDCRFLPPLPEPRATDPAGRVVERTLQLLRGMEGAILDHPEQYLWFYDRFKPRHHGWIARLKQAGVPMRAGGAVYGVLPEAT